MKSALSPEPATYTAPQLEAFIVAETLPHKQKGPPDDPLIGFRLDGRYTLERLIGEGGTGRVYQARQEATGREVAVKLLRDELLRDEASVRRFEREARAACRINHPSAIIVHDFGRSPEGHCYIVTELIDGETLRQHLDREGLQPPERALWIFFQILAGIAAAHERGVVHRDLHPGNIFVCRDDQGEERIKVFDFGGARLLDRTKDTDITGAGHLDLRLLLHSIKYLPPERLQRDRQPDTRGDVYALGLILFELCTGRYPYSTEDALQIMAMHLREPPPLLAIWAPDREFAPSLQGLISSMLAKDPQQRPYDAAEVTRRLQAALERAPLIQAHESEAVPEPELEVEMEALPPEPATEDGAADAELEAHADLETLPFAKVAPAPEAPRAALSSRSAPRGASAPRSSGPAPGPSGPAAPSTPSGRLLEDTVIELSPPGVAPVRAMVPEPPSEPSLSLAALRGPAPSSGRGAARTLLLALLCLLGGAGLVFAAGTVAYRLYHRPAAPPSQASAPQLEPAPAPLQP